jgi:hypothetical protein
MSKETIINEFLIFLWYVKALQQDFLLCNSSYGPNLHVSASAMSHYYRL